MGLNLKLKKIILLTSVAFFCAIFLLTGCSKDDNTPADKYQLEGTWQLYKTTTSIQTDSIYERSDRNEIIFAPKFYWRYANGVAIDSGAYTLIADQVTEQQFSGRINYTAMGTPAFILLKGDTLTLSAPSVIENTAVYIKSSDNSIFQ